MKVIINKFLPPNVVVLIDENFGKPTFIINVSGIGNSAQAIFDDLMQDLQPPKQEWKWINYVYKLIDDKFRWYRRIDAPSM